MGLVQSFSTAGLTSRHKVTYWNDRASECFLPLVCDPVDRDSFQGSMARARIGDFVLGEVNADAQIVRHTRSHALRMCEPMIYVHMQLEGHSLERQDGKEAVLRAGDFTLMDASRTHDTIISQHNRMLLLGIPVRRMRQNIENPECLVALRMPGDTGASGLLAHLLRSFWREYRLGLDATVADRTANTIMDMLATAYAQVMLTNPDARRASHSQTAHRIRILHFIAANLSNPELSPATIAAACHITPRYLHTLFENREETLSRYILRRRLEACERALASPLIARRRIGAIALDHGFNSLTHFGRTFRAFYGVSPGNYRRQCSTRS